MKKQTTTTAKTLKEYMHTAPAHIENLAMAAERAAEIEMDSKWEEHTERKTSPKAPAPVPDETPVSKFNSLKREFERAYFAKPDNFSDILINLATALTTSCVNKCLDPQRGTATERETVSNNGFNHAMEELRRGIYADSKLLANTARTAAKSTKIRFKKNGSMVTEINDKAANKALSSLLQKTLSDGNDLVNTAAMALLEQAERHAINGEQWLDKPYTVRRLSKKVYIRMDDSAAYKDVETTPMREAFRAVRKAIETSRAIQADPRNGYMYIEDAIPDGTDGMDSIYYRMSKYCDIGGYNNDGNYTADKQSAVDYYDVLKKLGLSDTQLSVVTLRMRGYGMKAIATYLGVKRTTVQSALKRVQAKCESIGFTPALWAEMTAAE